MAEDKMEYTDYEHEAMLQYLDLMHHETRAQTIARLEAAVKAAKASKSDAPSLATHEENVTRTVTEAPPEPAEKKTRVRRQKRG